jgi:hypothetical protein
MHLLRVFATVVCYLSFSSFMAETHESPPAPYEYTLYNSVDGSVSAECVIGSAFTLHAELHCYRCSFSEPARAQGESQMSAH